MVIDLDRSRDVEILNERPQLKASGKYLKVFMSHQDAEEAASRENMDLDAFVRRRDVFIPTERWAARWASKPYVNWTDRAMSEKARRRVGDTRSAADIAADKRCEDYDLRLTLTAQGAWNVKMADVEQLLQDRPGSDVFYLPTATRWCMVVGWDESAFLKRPGSKRTLTRVGSKHVQKDRTHKSSDDKDSETVTVFHNGERIIGATVLFTAAFCEQEYRDLFDPAKTDPPRQPSGTKERVAVCAGETSNWTTTLCGIQQRRAGQRIKQRAGTWMRCFTHTGAGLETSWDRRTLLWPASTASTCVTCTRVTLHPQ